LARSGGDWIKQLRTFLSEGRAKIPPMPEIVTAALVREGQVLLVHRSPNKHAYPNVWGLAGGHIDAGETELAALAREVHEELGVQIATGSLERLDRERGGGCTDKRRSR
jgi:8-oxo-dGTP pyrophosphatase MutT (NUDIX family)